MFLDVPTMLVMFIVTNLVMAIALLVVSVGRDTPGLRPLAWALSANTLIYVFYRPQPPGELDHLVMVVTNTLVSITSAFILSAVAQLRGTAPIPWQMLAPPALVLCLSVVLQDQPWLRIVTLNALLTAQQGLVLRDLLWRGGLTVGRGRYIVTGTTVVFTLVFGGRCLAVATGLVPPDPATKGGLLSTATYLTSYLAVVFIAFGMVLAATEIAAEQNRRLAMEDGLTGLPNRRAAMEALRRACAAAQRGNRPITLLLLDLDHFKSINDTHGHPAGDEVLRRVAQTIQRRLRTQDLAGRFGGEEFLVMLPDTAPEGGLVVAEALRAEIAATAIDVGPSTLTVTASIGLHGGQPAGPADLDAFIKRADDALYKAKGSGRNRVVAG